MGIALLLLADDLRLGQAFTFSGYSSKTKQLHWTAVSSLALKFLLLAQPAQAQPSAPATKHNLPPILGLGPAPVLPPNTTSAQQAEYQRVIKLLSSRQPEIVRYEGFVASACFTKETLRMAAQKP